MFASVHYSAVIGGDAHPALVDVDVARGLPAWSIVGLARNVVKEARECVASALVNSGFEVPGRRMTVRFSPPDGTAIRRRAARAAARELRKTLAEGSPSRGEA